MRDPGRSGAARRDGTIVDAHRGSPDETVIDLGVSPPAPSAEEWALNQPGVGYSCLTDDAWTCVFVTPSIERLLKVSSHDWLSDGRRWLEHTHPEDRERLLIERLAAWVERRRFSAEYRMLDVDGEIRWVRDEADLRGGPDPDPRFIHGLLTDVTYRHRSDRVLAAQYDSSRAEVRRLRQEIRERKAFVRLLAHDLRNPLTTIQGAVEMMLRFEGELEPARRHDLSVRAQAAAGRCRDLIHQLLEIDRWTASSSLDPRAIALTELVEGAITEVDTDRVRLDLDVPQDVDVVIDPVVVVRALSNLVANAVKHTDDGGTVRIRAGRRGGTDVLFSVEDEGPGVPDGLKLRVFEPYIALDAVDEVGSLGLGLALVTALAELHGGRVWVEDLPEVGSVFHLLVAEQDSTVA